MNSTTSTPVAKRGIGTLAGVIGATSFGFIPAFSIPLQHYGMSAPCILFYRFGIASILIAIILLSQGKSVSIPIKRLPAMSFLAVCYGVSSIFLLKGYDYMSAGVTGVIHFTYPLFVMIILITFYKERLRISSTLAILAAIAGIYCLGVLGGEASFIEGTNYVVGVIIVILSGLGCAGYMVGVNKTRVRELSTFVLTLWLLIFSTVYFGLMALIDGSLILVTDPQMIINLLLLGSISTVLSNFMLVFAIKNIGSTYASILGALEPVTAVILGIIIYNEALNIPISIGIILIFISVAIVIFRKKE